MRVAATAILSLSLLVPSAALADPSATPSQGATPPVQLQRTTPAETHVPLAPATTAPVMSPLAPTPKPVLSEGAKAGFIAGGIVVAALVITGVIVLHH